MQEHFRTEIGKAHLHQALRPATSVDGRLHQIFIFNQDISAISVTANEYFSRLSQWFVANKLSLNVDKTCLVTFAITKQIDLKIMTEKNKIINLDHCKYIGVYIDRDLKWTEYINQLCSKLKKYTGIFYRLRNK